MLLSSVVRSSKTKMRQNMKLRCTSMSNLALKGSGSSFLRFLHCICCAWRWPFVLCLVCHLIKISYARRLSSLSAQQRHFLHHSLLIKKESGCCSKSHSLVINKLWNCFMSCFLFLFFVCRHIKFVIRRLFMTTRASSSFVRDSIRVLNDRKYPP